MRIYEVRFLDDGKVQLIYSSSGEVKRMLTIKVGDNFYVQPDNPKKLLHRGRHCIIKGFQKDDTGNPIQAIVTFSDNGRFGKVDIQDLLFHSRQPRIIATLLHKTTCRDFFQKRCQAISLHAKNSNLWGVSQFGSARLMLFTLNSQTSLNSTTLTTV